MKLAAWVLGLASLVLSGCGTGTETVPLDNRRQSANIELPEGVTLTKPGTEIKVGKPATFTVGAGDSGSAVTATVTKIKRGKITDLKFFTLDAQSEAATPYYVTVKVKNLGPGGLGSTTPPFLLRDDQDTLAVPASLNGTFPLCNQRSLPATFLPGNSATACLVFLLPKGARAKAVEAQSKDQTKTVSWRS